MTNENTEISHHYLKFNVFLSISLFLFLII